MCQLEVLEVQPDSTKVIDPIQIDLKRGEEKKKRSLTCIKHETFRPYFTLFSVFCFQNYVFKDENKNCFLFFFFFKKQDVFGKYFLKG